MSKVNKYLFWGPRILGIIVILFLSLFSLDVFDGNSGFWGIIGALFMHNLPSLILLVVLIISWNYEIVGAVVFIFAGCLYTFIVLTSIALTFPHPYYMLFWPVPIAGPAIIVGILFWINWIKKKK